MAKKESNKKTTTEEAVKNDTVIPAHFRIDENEVQATFDCESFVLSRAGGYMHYATKGGYHIFVQPSYTALYDTLNMLLDLLIENEKQGEPNETLSNITDFISSLLFAPTILFTNDDIMMKAFEHLTEFVQQMAEDAMKEPLPQDYEANADFEQTVKSAEELAEQLQDIEKSLPDDIKSRLGD